VLASSPSSPAPTPTIGLKATLTFSYTGSVQQWVVPVGLATFTVDAYGAAGGDLTGFWNCNGGPCLGGLGGYISVSNIAASSFVGQTLFIYVGGAGAQNTAPGLGGGGGGCCHTVPAVGSRVGQHAMLVATPPWPVPQHLRMRLPSICQDGQGYRGCGEEDVRGLVPGPCPQGHYPGATGLSGLFGGHCRA
jgi:hypothetical protein